MNRLKPTPKTNLLALSMTVLPLLLLQGCGSSEGGSGDNGGDSGAATPPAPSLTLTPTATKTFAFSWSDVSGETEYRLLENPDDASGYSQIAVIPADSTDYDITVSLPQRINASYILQACDNDGCTDSEAVFVTGSLAEAVGYFKASNTERADQFGDEVSLSADGRVMAVSAYDEDNGTGAVYVFTEEDGTWSQQAYVKPQNSEDFDRFGSSLALSADGRVLAAGATREASSATGIDGDETDNTLDDSGAVYVFTQSDGTWSQQAYIKASNPDEDDAFGAHLALSADGSTLAVGVPAEDSAATGIDGDQTDNSELQSGAVYVFTQSGDTWAQQEYIKASNADANDRFGYSLALSSDGSVLAVGAYGEQSSATGINGDQTNNSAFQTGAVYVFTRSADTWSQQAYLKASNAQSGDSFGASLALSTDGLVLAVSASGEGSAATGIDGNQSDNSLIASGAVYVFSQSSNVWSQQAYIKSSTAESNDGFGYNPALSADGATLAVAAIGEDSSATGINGDETDNTALTSGAVYLFTQSNGIWTQQAYIKASNTEGSDYFGSGLALSADGGVLAVGAYREDSAATGINGNQDSNSASLSGAVYLY